MAMESQYPMDTGIHFQSDNVSAQDGDPGVASFKLDHIEPQKIEKRPTRRWAAWTHQEEENFFTALRQVGKNFEKITHRVQSKNKDQVRHYYYRLVRRMNKLLGPGLGLDAKNSKDTNAAMLRWWSLLEKYSCKASKLHLKPRRFKIFVEALENQLLKDRKKNVRKRSLLGENGSPTAPNTIVNQNRQLGYESRAVKLVLVDSQNIQKIGAGKGSLKRNVGLGVFRANNKGDSTALRHSRQKRKQVGVVYSAAYKKWEKAAIAGVSLVADAAEHLERAASNKEVEYDHDVAGRRDLTLVDKDMLPYPAPSLNHVESSVHVNLKLKLQLFPIDEATRRTLEMDNHNPHLELTLSSRKRIASVLEHLNRKWGSSSVASGELVLFPYGVNRDNLAGSERWKQDSIVSAADVYGSIGSPLLFRLRYGWFTNSELASTSLQLPAASSFLLDGNMVDTELEKRIMDFKSTNDPSSDHLTTEVNKDDVPALSVYVYNGMSRYIISESGDTSVMSTDPGGNVSLHREEAGNRNNTKQMEDVDDLRYSAGIPSAGEWADTLTNISIGDLLSEVPHDTNVSCHVPPIAESDQCLQQLPFSCDSFDAAIAAHFSRHQEGMGSSSTVIPHASSIWDAEDTCDAFVFQRNRGIHQEVPISSSIASPQAGKQINNTNASSSNALVEELPDAYVAVDSSTDEDEASDECVSDTKVVDNSTKDFAGLTDIYWPDSLGLLDLDIPPSKYHTEDVILSDSLGNWNHLIASSLDAFQSCSCLGLNKKDTNTTIEARDSASFSDFKIGSGI